MVFCSHLIVLNILQDTKLNLLLLIHEVFRLCKSDNRLTLNCLPYFHPHLEKVIFSIFCVVAFWCLESIRLDEITNLNMNLSALFSCTLSQLSANL